MPEAAVQAAAIPHFANNIIFLEGYNNRTLAVTRSNDGETTHTVIFAKPERLELMRTNGYLTIIDSTYKTNSLNWKLFTLMVRNNRGLWLPCAHFATKTEDGDIIAESLKVIRSWTSSHGPIWLPR